MQMTCNFVFQKCGNTTTLFKWIIPCRLHISCPPFLPPLLSAPSPLPSCVSPPPTDCSTVSPPLLLLSTQHFCSALIPSSRLLSPHPFFFFFRLSDLSCGSRGLICSPNILNCSRAKAYKYRRKRGRRETCTHFSPSPGPRDAFSL